MLRNLTNMREFNRVQKQYFINAFFDGDKQKYLKARKEDYNKVQFDWMCWMDSLLKDGEITHQQWEKAEF